MADVKDKPKALADDTSCDVDGSDRPELEPWSEERARRCDEWMEKFIGRYKLGFEVDVQEYFDKYAE